MGILEGQVAIVTGAGRGIGRAIAEEYALEGASVVVASRTLSSVTEVVTSITDAGGSAVGVSCDVSEPEQLAEMVDTAVRTFGGVNILVNNAQSFGTKANPAASTPITAVEEITDAEWDWTFETGVKATLRTMQLVLPHLRKAGGGSIINFGSRLGIFCAPNSAPYNATKEAIRALSRTAAAEWGQYGIRVNVINPVVETDSARDWLGAHPGVTRELIEGAIPLGRWGKPYECARVAVFLAGKDSSYLTGLTLMADGGQTSLP